MLGYYIVNKEVYDCAPGSLQELEDLVDMNSRDCEFYIQAHVERPLYVSREYYLIEVDQDGYFNYLTKEEQIMAGNGGFKDDKAKYRMSYTPRAAVRATAEMMTERVNSGAHKANNWRQGFEWTRLSDALERHLHSWLEGENIDPDSGHSHLTHVAANALMLLEHELKSYGKDDRYKG